MIRWMMGPLATGDSTDIRWENNVEKAEDLIIRFSYVELISSKE